MLRDYVCEECGHTQEVWRQLAKNMPEDVPCTSPIDRLDGSGCPGRAFPDDRLYPTKTVYKGEGWTPPTHSSESILDIETED
jgi:hypothetical protein